MDKISQYRQLQPEDRMTMASMRQQGLSASTITRELARNTVAELPYGSHTAQVACVGRRLAARPAAKLDFDGVGWGTVRTMLDWKWSPQQIAATLKRVAAQRTRTSCLALDHLHGHLRPAAGRVAQATRGLFAPRS